ncbi:hypothetical protein [Cupriavidus plantarum]|nr:hypothetical protein [Cupriavidus plantarum]REE91207.1 hypothetical protein C7418_4510 [Cupriavidus plantarum]
MEALSPSLSRLSRHAQACAEALSAAAAAASDPQARAVLAHRANMQRCAAGELATRACAYRDDAAAEPSPTDANSARRRDVALTPPSDNGELARLRHAAQQVARAAAAYGSVLRDPLPDPELRLLLAHYYRGATELQRLLDSRVADFKPARQSASGVRRNNSPSPELTHR